MTDNYQVTVQPTLCDVEGAPCPPQVFEEAVYATSEGCLEVKGRYCIAEFPAGSWAWVTRERTPLAEPDSVDHAADALESRKLLTRALRLMEDRGGWGTLSLATAIRVHLDAGGQR